MLGTTTLKPLKPVLYYSNVLKGAMASLLPTISYSNM